MAPRLESPHPGTTTALAAYSYTALARDPRDVAGLEVPGQTPLPPLVEPAEMPPVDDDCGEALVPVAGITGIIDLAAYRHAGWPGAPERSWVRRGVAARLGAVAAQLPDPFGLAVFDAWRPLALQQAIYDAAYVDPSLPPGFVSVPSTDPATPPPHLTGGTVDVTLTHRGVPLALGTEFDDFTPASRAAAFEGTPGTVRELRRMLFAHMVAAGFVVIACEWWHFEYGTRRWAALTGNVPFYGAVHRHS